MQLRELADALRVSPAELPERVERLVSQVKELQDELAAERSRQTGAEAAALAAAASDGVLVVRRDGASPDDLRRLALAARDALGHGVVAVVGRGADGAKAGLVVAVTKDLVGAGVSAADLARDAARLLGGGTGKNADVAVGGGPNVAAVDDAVDALATAARAALDGA